VQFMPAFVLPQILLSGLLVDRDQMARLLELVSAVLPLTYAYDALVRATADDLGSELLVDTALVLLAIGLSLVLGATTLRRRTV
jgi:ABC-2 type transport system permease protein